MGKGLIIHGIFRTTLAYCPVIVLGALALEKKKIESAILIQSIYFLDWGRGKEPEFLSVYPTCLKSHSELVI